MYPETPKGVELQVVDFATSDSRKWDTRLQDFSRDASNVPPTSTMNYVIHRNYSVRLLMNNEGNEYDLYGM